MMDKPVSTHAGVTSRHSALSSDYTLEVTVFVAVLVALIIGFILGRYKTYASQNRGEAMLSRALNMRFVAPDYHLLNHVTLRLDVDFNSPCPIRQQLMSNSPCAPRFTSILERRSTVLGGTRAAKIPVVASASHEPLGRIEIAMRLGALEL